MPRADITIGLACWKPELAAQRVAVLSRHGFRADTSFASTSGMVGRVLRVQPAAIVIDLDRLPAYGREVGHVVRQSKSTRHVPLVFAGGAPEKVAAIRRDLS